MTNAEATTSTDRTGTGKAEAAPVQNVEAERLHALLEPAVLANRLYLEDVSIHVAGANRVVHVVVDLPQEETGGVALTSSPRSPRPSRTSWTTIRASIRALMSSRCRRPVSAAR